jgi:hypothetical protein
MNSWPVDIAVVFVLCPSDQVKITAHHHWVLASRDLILKLFKKCWSSRVISWSVEPDILKDYLGKARCRTTALIKNWPWSIKPTSNILSMKPSSNPPECPEAGTQLQ